MAAKGSLAAWVDGTHLVVDNQAPAVHDAESAYRFLIETLPPAERAELVRLLLEIAP